MVTPLQMKATNICNSLTIPKEELFLDFGLAHSKNIPALLDSYVDFFNNHRLAAALGYKSPVQYKTELGFG